MARQFIADIEPYFYARPVVYVDVGAHNGKVFALFAESGLDLREAHLIEPNPTSFAALERTVATVTGVKLCRTHNIALGDGAGRVRITDADTMSRVIDPAQAAPDTGFEVECATLDALAQTFEAKHISILKIDVEGFEPRVLAGAAGLLAVEAIDMIYVEAGMNAEGTQQSYYRVIEDMLVEFRYRLFRLYEQKHEWREDSPLLRRVNLAFMSESFAARNPHRLSRELFDTRQENEALKAEAKSAQAAEAEMRDVLAEARRALAELRAAAEAVGAMLETERRAAKQARTALEEEHEAVIAAEEALAEAVQNTHTLTLQSAALAAEQEAARTAALSESKEARARLAAMLAYGRELEKKYADLLESRTWRAMAPVRWLGRRLTHRQPPPAFVRWLTDDGTALLTAAQGRAASQKKYGTAGKPTRLGKSRAARLEDKLWGGFSQTALAELEALKADAGVHKTERSEAAWALARWHAARGNVDGAYENVVLMRTTDPGKAGVMRCVLLEADCLMRRGAAAAAQSLLQTALRRRPDSPDLFLAMANSYLPADGRADPAQDAVRLDWINRVYRQAGLAPLIKHDPAGPLAIDNLATSPGRVAGSEGLPRISVIMPVFQAAATLSFALRGLLAQTWANLEVIVVDDHSPDNTVAVAEEIAARDPRVRVLRQPENLGSYAARNAGLRVATGDFITTHDADDWSHSQKLEIQARHMVAHSAASACFSDWVRCSATLRVGWLHRAWGGLSAKNMSSIMLRRDAMEALGAWDVVRVGGDTDLLRRLEVLFGEASIHKVRSGTPLSFSLHAERSLTRQAVTHVSTMLHGARREYNEAGAYWRQGLGSRAALRLSPTATEANRPFPAPPPILGRQFETQVFDLMFINDFCLKGGAFVSTQNSIEAALAAGFSVGVFHWRRYDLDVTQPLNPVIRRLAQKGALRIVAPGEKVRARTVVVGYPAVLRYPVDLAPETDCDDVIVVVNQMAERLYSGGDPQYDPEELRRNLRAMFGTEDIWAPISGLVHRLMRADPRYPAPSDTIWVPLIDTGIWCQEPPRWRGQGGAAPVIGRHARDHYTKWPTSAVALRGAYCADRPCGVEIMGGADRAFDVIGSRPTNWTVHRFGEMESLAFLRRLDFFVHYPHEDYIEEFGRAVLEALAVGLPAVLPPVFRETFGPAALYSEPGDVWSTIQRLWADEAAYLAQAKAGRDFVIAHSDWSQIAERLARTVAGARPSLDPQSRAPQHLAPQPLVGARM